MDIIAGIACVAISTNVRCYIIASFLTTLSFSKTMHPVRVAFNTVQLLQCKTLNLLSPELWPCNSPQLNSTDYEIYTVI